jgi:dihydrofolate synthase / folylpolyglutamate synthase
MIISRRYAETLSEIFGFSSLQRGAAEVRADRLKKPARLKALLAELGHPELSFQCVLVAGTKGKGSTTAMTASILQAAGLRVGRYTQPHLVSWRERTWVNGRHLSVNESIRLFPFVRSAARRVESHHPELGTLTTFEIGTAFSLLSFAKASVDAAVVEVGVGGRNDATNALDPIVSVITPISLDHVDVIGPKIVDIAHEKAGVMRPGMPVIVGSQPPDAEAVIRDQSTAVGASVEWIGRDWNWKQTRASSPLSSRHAQFAIHGPGRSFERLRLPLLGTFQRENAASAVAAAIRTQLIEPDRLDRAVHQGLSMLLWPGRVHVLSEHPALIFDGAHNAESARQLESTIRQTYGDVPIHWVLGMSRGKDVGGFLDAIRSSATTLVATTASHERSMPAESLAQLARERLGASSNVIQVAAYADPVSALNYALSQAKSMDVVCAAGSFFLLGDLYAEYLHEAKS